MLHFIGFYNYTVILTYMSLASAVIGMVQAVNGNFTAAVICLVICGICDAFDGTVARSKKDRTEDEKSFGIQLDSLCDSISFGVFPAVLCYAMGTRSIFGILCMCLYALCAVIRLAFFNVMEMKRQQTEGGSNKVYRGLPVTSISIIFPPVYLLRLILPDTYFIGVLHLTLLLVAFLFILDFKVKKPDFGKLLPVQK